MAYLSIAVLLITVSFLAYRKTQTSPESLPQWLRPAKRRGVGGEQDVKSSETPNQDTQGDTPDQPAVYLNVTEHTGDEGTPKATPFQPSAAVPTLALDGDYEETRESQTPSLVVPPSSPAIASPQRTSSASKSPNGTLAPPAKPPANLMPPPPRPVPVPPRSSAASLRVPSNGPLPNRGPPQNRQQRVNGGLSPNGAIAVPKARGKVLLSPGHSPMDWAALTKTKNLSGVNTFQRVTPSKLKSMTGRKGKPAWTTWQGKVYNITPYLSFHPGGEAELMKAAGRDGTKLFLEVHPWVNWENMLGSCLVGALVPESDGVEGVGEGLESID